MATILPSGQHYGTITRQWRSDAFTMNEVHYASGSKYALHGNEQSSLLLTLAGRGAKKMSGKELICRRNAMLFIPAERLQRDAFVMDTKFLAIEFFPVFFRDIDQRDAVPPTEVMLSAPDAVHLGMRLATEFNHPDGLSPLVFEGLLLNILVGAAREHSSSARTRIPQWLRKAKDMLHDCAAPPSLFDIAKEVNIHPVHLSREFRRFFHCTPGEYLRKRRVELAVHHLKDSDLPLSQIALTTGFADQAHFSRTFRRVTHLSPSEFRRLARGD